jgi:two-component system KDP operon response regulator KdpE
VFKLARILVVDDEPIVRNLVRKTLERVGHEVGEAEDGEVALNLSKEQAFDLVVADLFMPVMDGLQLIVQLREESPDTKVVAISGSVYERKPRFLEIAGRMESVITLAKPFTAEELLAAVEEALGK